LECLAHTAKSRAVADILFASAKYIQTRPSLASRAETRKGAEAPVLLDDKWLRKIAVSMNLITAALRRAARNEELRTPSTLVFPFSRIFSQPFLLSVISISCLHRVVCARPQKPTPVICSLYEQQCRLLHTLQRPLRESLPHGSHLQLLLPLPQAAPTPSNSADQAGLISSHMTPDMASQSIAV